VRAYRAIATFASTLALGVLWLAGAPTWAAQREEHGPEQPGHVEVRHEGTVFHGDIGRFHEHDWAVWHGGRWEHGYHGGRLGWWWVAGGLWYFYPYPVYPYPDPYVPPLVVAPPAQSGVLPPAPTPTNWYYCESAHGYYPYVMSCPEGWRMVPANPVAGGAPPAQR
jgi:hypothetical protein